jgi:hypothetical protein
MFLKLKRPWALPITNLPALVVVEEVLHSETRQERISRKESSVLFFRKPFIKKSILNKKNYFFIKVGFEHAFSWLLNVFKVIFRIVFSRLFAFVDVFRGVEREGNFSDTAKVEFGRGSVFWKVKRRGFVRGIPYDVSSGFKDTRVCAF